MHTNFDVAAMADAAADLLCMQEQDILMVTGEDGGGPHGIGKTGRAPVPMTLRETAEAVKKAFRIPRRGDAIADTVEGAGINGGAHQFSGSGRTHH
jgi:putative NIF3 family GTP cyclohydrolase 1 type 2